MNKATDELKVCMWWAYHWMWKYTQAQGPRLHSEDWYAKTWLGIAEGLGHSAQGSDLFFFSLGSQSTLERPKGLKKGHESHRPSLPSPLAPDDSFLKYRDFSFLTTGSAKLHYRSNPNLG